MRQRTHGFPAPRTRVLRVFATLAMVTALSGCNLFTRLSEVGSEPALTSIRSPATLHGNQPVQMPMPAPVEAVHHPNSLWRPGSRAFFKDQRARRVGDILTVKVVISDSAKIENKTSRSRTTSEDVDLDNLAGLEQTLRKNLPFSALPSDLIALD